MKKYDPREIEKKWQEKWEKDELYKTEEDKNKPKYYILDMFPYPSGAGLHVGHPKGYIATDIFARAKIMQGYSVLHPMGWDAFGLPAENFALKNKVHPKISTSENVETYKRQLKMFGFSYDWGREINTTDPDFYKWTQWIFLQMFKKGLAYESHEPIIWCPSCKTGLATEDLEGGACERCGSEVERKPMRQWVLRITDYAERMLADLKKLPDWEDSIKEMQRNWIGKSEGAEVDFDINGKKVTIFTTRPDTLFGTTYFVLAPEHLLLEEMKNNITNYKEVEIYIKNAQKKSDLERTDLAKEKTGVEVQGIKAINPVNGEKIPVWVADYVLIGYGTGAIMAVPAHDERDWEFAKKYDISIIEVLEGGDIKKEAFIGEGSHINSGFLNGTSKKEGIEKMIIWLEKEKLGKRAINYKLNDWVFSRQRYWGEPIPIIHCEKCGVVPVPEEELPVKLPDVENYEPTGTGESPLAAIEDWVNTNCPVCGGKAKRETNTMPQWAGSSWYYLRYIDPKNDKVFVDKNKEKYWSPVDFYVGGAEHATRHLIYARFWHKFLYDIGAVSYDEPFTRLQHVGLILAEDGRKMSKRWGNVVNPDDIIALFGADAMRIYEMFMGPFSQPCAWNTNGVVGSRKFLEKVYKYFETYKREGEEYIAEWVSEYKKGGKYESKGKEYEMADTDPKIKTLLHKTIKKVTEDIEEFKFNTAISQMMIFVNSFYKTFDYDHKEGGVQLTGSADGFLRGSDFKKFLKLLAPFAPHITEELWFQTGEKNSIFRSEWPKYDEKELFDEMMTIVIQVNGKVRDNIKVKVELDEDEIKKVALAREVVARNVNGKEIKRIIYVKNKLLNIVV